MVVITFILNSHKETLLLQQSLIMLQQIWLVIRNKFSVQFWSVCMLIPYKMQLILLTAMLGVTVAQFSLDQVQLLENSKTKLNVDKLVLTYPSQSHYLCFLSLEIKNLSMEIWISMVKTELNSSPNGKPLQLVGKKMPNSLN